MKSTGFVELAFVLAIMAAAVPLLVLLMYVCNANSYSYLDDKTTINDSYQSGVMGDYEYDGTIKITSADYILSYIIYDEYSPSTRLAKYNGVGGYDVSASVNNKYNVFRNTYFPNANLNGLFEAGVNTEKVLHLVPYDSGNMWTIN